MNRWSALAILLAVAGALALRIPQLASRPFHNDEAVNAIKVTELWQQGRYAYDPDEYHGPTLHYFTLPFLWCSGARSGGDLTDATLRLAPVAFGVALILLLPLFAHGLGRPATAWAAVFLAVSPAMVFYSRYFIHEIFLVFFTALTIGAAWRYWQTRAARWAILTGVGVGLMAATKETFVLNLAALALAAFAVSRWKQRAPHGPAPTDSVPSTQSWNRRHLMFATAAAAAVWLILFSSFFTHWSGPLDSVRTYFPWLKRAGGHSPHIHPWYFYLQRLGWFHTAKGPIWTEALILGLAVVGIGVSFSRRRPPLARFLAIYTLVLTAIYCAISYKTPWCLLGFHHGYILLAGLGAAALIQLSRHLALRFAIAIALVAGAAQLAGQAWQGATEFSADRRNPYVYAQTLPDLLNLTERLDGLARVAPTHDQTIVKVIAPENDYWPLPWYLRRFKQIGWYDKVPDDPWAPIVIASSQLGARLDDKSDRKWIMAGLFALRPGTFFELYVELDLWKKYVETLPRPSE